MWSPEALKERNGPMYRAIADTIAEAVDEGRLSPGERLPTHRELAEKLQVTVGTVTRGYAEAGRRGLVEGLVGSGTFVRERRGRSSTFGLTADDRPGVVPLGLAVPTFLEGELEGRRLAETLDALAREGGGLTPLLGCYDARGSDFQRGAGARWIGRTGLEADPERVVLTSGAQHALTVLLSALTTAGDVVLCESLTYPGIRSVAAALGVRLRGVAMDGEGILPDALEEACRALEPRAIYLIPTLQNPTTGTLSPERRQAVARIARDEDVVVVEDDIHAGLAPEPVLPVAHWAPDHVCYVASTSKTVVPGLRIGFVHPPERLEDRIRAGVRTTTWMPVQLMAEIAARWIEDGTADEILRTRRRETQARGALTLQLLEGLDAWWGEGSPSVWLHLPEPWCSRDLVPQAGQRGVAVVGADDFAVERQDVPHAVRLAISAPRSRDELRKGIAVVRELLEGPGDPALSVV